MNSEQPTNADLKHFFEEHATNDEVFQEKSIASNVSVSASLASIHQRLGEMQAELAELKENQKELKTNMEPFIEIVQIGVIGRKMVIWTSGFVVAGVALVSSIISLLRYFKG